MSLFSTGLSPSDITADGGGLDLQSGLRQSSFSRLADTAAPSAYSPSIANFFMGIMAWAAWKDGRLSVITATSALLGLLAIAALAIGQNIGMDRAVPIAIAAGFAALLPWLVIGEQKGRIRTPKILGFLGDASYSIYLVHALPLLLLVQIMAGSSWHALFLVIGFAGLSAGIAYHLLVERPLLAWRQKS